MTEYCVFIGLQKVDMGSGKAMLLLRSQPYSRGVPTRFFISPLGGQYPYKYSCHEY